MKNTISVMPADNEMQIAFEALSLLNDFRAMGYTTRNGFIEVIGDKIPKYQGVNGYNLLARFWLGRMRSPELNNDVQTVLQALKSE